MYIYVICMYVCVSSHGKASRLICLRLCTRIHLVPEMEQIWITWGGEGMGGKGIIKNYDLHAPALLLCSIMIGRTTVVSKMLFKFS